MHTAKTPNPVKMIAYVLHVSRSSGQVFKLTTTMRTLSRCLPSEVIADLVTAVDAPSGAIYDRVDVVGIATVRTPRA